MTPERGQPLHRRRGWRVVVLTLAAAAIATAALLPPAPQQAPPAKWVTAPTVRGAYHIHSSRSDGAGTLDDIARAAADAGLQFVIVTDHGDGTRPPEAPGYRHGVLCVDGVELNTDDGHYVALGLSATPYPLAGSAESVVEDVARLGGFGLAAHADSPRVSLQWRAWSVPFDGLEWLNADTEWRDESWSALARAMLTYPVRPAATLASLLDSRQALVSRWDRMIGSRRVPVLAGADAHAWLGTGQDSDPDTSGWYLPLPRYRSSFAVFSNHVVLDRPFSGDPADDSGRLLTAIRQGRAFTVIDGLAGPGGFEFTGASGDRTANIGDDLPLVGRATLKARMAAPAGASMALIRNGATIDRTTESERSIDVTTPGAYRVEVTLPGNAFPWIFSNPIYVGFNRSMTPPTGPAPVEPQMAVALQEASSEVSPGSASELVKGVGLIWQYRLAAGTPAGQYAAIRLPVSGSPDFSRIRFDVGADRPMRLWLQIRRPGGAAGERWGRTFYVDQADRTIDVRLDALAPIGATTTAGAPLAQIDSLLVVADTVNTLPGSEGRVRISKVAFAK
jgi:hypothetical protein